MLLAHIVSTRCRGDVIADQDMDYPRDWRNLKGRSVDVGHQETGQTVGLHSLAVSPKLQGCGVGKMIVKAYLQQMNNSGLASRVSLICQDVGRARGRRWEYPALTTVFKYLVRYYERFGFKHKGESKAQFGGGGWHDMVTFATPLLAITRELTILS